MRIRRCICLARSSALMQKGGINECFQRPLCYASPVVCPYSLRIALILFSCKAGKRLFQRGFGQSLRIGPNALALEKYSYKSRFQLITALAKQRALMRANRPVFFPCFFALYHSALSAASPRLTACQLPCECANTLMALHFSLPFLALFIRLKP